MSIELPIRRKEILLHHNHGVCQYHEMYLTRFHIYLNITYVIRFFRSKLYSIHSCDTNREGANWKLKRSQNIYQCSIISVTLIEVTDAIKISIEYTMVEKTEVLILVFTFKIWSSHVARLIKNYLNQFKILCHLCFSCFSQKMWFPS